MGVYKVNKTIKKIQIAHKICFVIKMTQVKMKPGSSTIFASCSVDCTVKIWDMKLKDDPLVHSLEVSLQFTRHVLSKMLLL